MPRAEISIYLVLAGVIMVPLGFVTVLFVYFSSFNIGLVIPTGVTVGVLGSVLAFYECNNASQESQQDSRNEPALSTRSESVDSFGALSLDVPRTYITPHNSSPIPIRPTKAYIPENQDSDAYKTARRSSDHHIITVSENLPQNDFPVMVFCFDRPSIDTSETVIPPNVPSIFDHGPIVDTKGLRYDSNNFRLLRPFWKRNRFVKSSVAPQQY